MKLLVTANIFPAKAWKKLIRVFIERNRGLFDKLG